MAIDPAAPDHAIIHRAEGLLQQGGLVVFPTRHLYGLGVDALNPAAVERVFAVKRRSPRQPILILVASRDAVHRYVRNIPGPAAALMEAFWPGKLTIILEAAAMVPQVLTGGTGRIGIRVPGHPVCQAMLRALGRPITATSANLSGRSGCRRIEALHPAVAAAADLILDAGPLTPGIGSTVVDVLPSGVEVLREGAVAVTALQAVAGDLISVPAPGSNSSPARRPS